MRVSVAWFESVSQIAPQYGCHSEPSSGDWSATLSRHSTTWLREPKLSHPKVRNTYRVLLTREMRGCYVCFLDKDTENFVRSPDRAGCQQMTYRHPRLSAVPVLSSRLCRLYTESAAVDWGRCPFYLEIDL